MSTTIPYVFTGPTKAPLDIVESIYDAYCSAQGDEDKAGDVDDAAFYEGQKDAYLTVLRWLHDDEPTIADVYPATGGWVYPGKVKSEPMTTCEACRARHPVGEDCPNYGYGPTHA